MTVSMQDFSKFASMSQMVTSMQLMEMQHRMGFTPNQMIQYMGMNNGTNQQVRVA